MRIEYLEAALSDLDNITDYYFALFGIESAMKVYDQIRASVGQLDEYPGSGVPCKDRQLKILGYRELFVNRRRSIQFRRILHDHLSGGDDVHFVRGIRGRGCRRSQ